MKWRRVLGRLVGLIVLLIALVWAYPYLKNFGKVVRLFREPAPVALPVPVEGVAPGQLANTWGAERSEGRRHEGIDIFAPRGTPVISATHGVVVRKGWNRLGGRTVTVLGPDGWFHYYAHLDGWDAPGIGAWIEAGTVLGYVGDSGNAKGTPTHLHYGIYESGAARNPYPLLKPLRRPPRPSP
jgi:peptidoglycan LD-endopeptidase LytH